MVVNLIKRQVRKINTTQGAITYFTDASFIMDLYLICKVHTLISSRAAFLNQWDLTFGGGGGWELGSKNTNLFATRMCRI
jgi:hypothetical protein